MEVGREACFCILSSRHKGCRSASCVCVCVCVCRCVCVCVCVCLCVSVCVCVVYGWLFGGHSNTNCGWRAEAPSARRLMTWDWCKMEKSTTTHALVNLLQSGPLLSSLSSLPPLSLLCSSPL